MIVGARHIGLVFVLVMALTGMVRAQDAGFDFRMLDAPQAMPDLDFSDATGRRMSLEDFRGKYVLLNVWATWCPPCREELPALDRLQGELGGAAFQVVALSTDTGRPALVKRLYRELNLSDSGIFIDETGSAMRTLRVFALPTTLLIDPTGQEIGRKTGPAVWDDPAAVAFFRSRIEAAQDNVALPVE